MRLRNRVLAGTLLVLGCGTNAAQKTPTSPPVAAPTAAQPSAHPAVNAAVNAEYRKPDLEVGPWIERFERAGREIFDRRLDILKATGVAPGTVVADVGAGTGLFTLLFAEAVGAGGQVYAVDVVPRFLAHIDSQARARRLGNVTTILGTDRSISLPEASVDLIFVCDTYHHFEYPGSVNASLRKALRPGGRLVLIDFRRVTGKSPAWVFEHVRAGQEVFTAELERAGFQLVDEVRLLQENYLLRFARPAPEAQ